MQSKRELLKKAETLLICLKSRQETLKDDNKAFVLLGFEIGIFEVLIENMRRDIQPLSSLVDTYVKTEDNLIKAIEELPNYGKDCSCGSVNKDTVALIKSGEFPEIQTFCLKCGGFLEK